jgi:hypothetical protein
MAQSRSLPLPRLQAHPGLARLSQRAAWNSVKDWLLDRITYAEPPPVDEAVEVGEALLDTAYGAIPNARALLDDADDKPLRWLLRRWDWCRRNQ